jgi:hypothetical protein
MLLTGYDFKVGCRTINIPFRIPAKVYPEGSSSEVIELKRLLRLSDRKVEELQKALDTYIAAEQKRRSQPREVTINS